MNIKVELLDNKPTIPKVGEFWMHRPFGTVYLRISDYSGAKALDDVCPIKDQFYSVRLECFNVYRTSLSDTVIILKPKSEIVLIPA